MKPNLTYDHGYAIARIDSYGNLDVPLESRIAIPKVVRDHATAEKEVARLRALNEEKGAVYFWVLTRIERSI